MPAQDALAAGREALSALAAAVAQIRTEFGDTLGVRRLTSDVDRLAEALDQLGDPLPGHRPPVTVEEMILIPDEAYDESMWRDAQSETQLGQ